MSRSGEFTGSNADVILEHIHSHFLHEYLAFANSLGGSWTRGRKMLCGMNRQGKLERASSAWHNQGTAACEINLLKQALATSRKGLSVRTFILAHSVFAGGLLAYRFFVARLAVVTIAAGLIGPPVFALDTELSAPFLQKTGFDLSSAGFRVKFANDAASQRALRALPPNRFVIHTVNGVDHYLFADPKVCVCIFVGNKDNYLSYRSILQNPLGSPPDNVAPDYKTNAEVMLSDPLGTDSIYEPDTVAQVLQDYY